MTRISYSIMFTRDVDFVIVKLAFINVHRVENNQIFHKHYDLRKNQHFTFVRNVQSFNNFYFEILLYFNRDLQRLHNVNRQEMTSYFSSQSFNRSRNLNISFESNISIIKTQQFKIFIQVKRCAVVSLKIDDNIQINFEVRMKYRMLLKKYRNRIMTFLFNIHDL